MPNNPLEHLPIDVSSRLQVALQLPRANKDIARWLFSNRRASFHSPGAISKLESSSNCIVCSLHHDFDPDQGSSSKSTRTAGSSRPPSRVRNPSRPFSTLFLPIERYGSTVVGYSLTASYGVDSRIYPFDVPSGKISVRPGRFAFDSSKKHLVQVQHGVSTGLSMISVVNWYHGNRRQRCCISIPCEEYTPERLPTVAKGMTVINEIRLGSTVAFPENPKDGLDSLEQEYRRTVDRSSQHSHRNNSGRGGTTGAFGHGRTSSSSERRTNVEGIWTDANVLGLHPNLLYDLSGQDQFESESRSFADNPEAQSSRRGRNGNGEGGSSSQNNRHGSHTSSRGTSAIPSSSSSRSSRYSRDQPLFNMTAITGRSSNRQGSTSVGPLTGSSLKESLDDLQQCLFGSFFCPKVYRGTRDSRYIGNLLTTTQSSPRNRQDLLRGLALSSCSSSHPARPDTSSSRKNNGRNGDRKDRNDKRQRHK